MIGLNPFSMASALWRRAAVACGDVPAALAALRCVSGVQGVVLLAGSRRCECYLAIDEGLDGFELVAGFFAARAGVPLGDCMPYLYMAERGDAAAHLVNVACGLDSFAAPDEVGLRCVCEAITAAKTQASSHELLDELFDRAGRLAERVCLSDEASGQATVFANVVSDVVCHAFGDLPKREVLVLGGGYVCERVAHRLADNGVTRFAVAHTNADQAASIAGSIGAVVRCVDDAEECLARADVVIAASGGLSPNPRMMRRVYRARRGRMLLVFDLAKTSDFEEACAGIDNVFLYTRADLERLSEGLCDVRSCAGHSSLDLAAEEVRQLVDLLEE